MSKFNDFFAKITEDDALKTEVMSVLGDNSFEDATDEQLAKIGEIAKRAGFDITVEEAKAHFENDELDEDDLDAVAGGKGKTVIKCSMGTGSIDDSRRKAKLIL